MEMLAYGIGCFAWSEVSCFSCRWSHRCHVRIHRHEKSRLVSDGGKWEKLQRRFPLNWASRADWRLNSVRMENGMIRAVGHLFNWVVD